jgi:hypothetical protein
MSSREGGLPGWFARVQAWHAFAACALQNRGKTGAPPASTTSIHHNNKGNPL